jgi:hypothetical protein
MVAVSQFGMRRVRISTTVAASAPAASATNAGLEIVRNYRPEHLVNRVPQRRDRPNGDDRDQRRQQSVLEQILSVFRTPEAGAGNPPQDGNGNW